MFAMFSLAVIAPTETFAAGDCNNPSTFLGLRPWYKGLLLEKNDSCVVAKPAELFSGDSANAVFTWTIVLNVLYDAFMVVGLAAIIFAIYGGFIYMTSQGDASKIASGKKTFINAVIGLVLTILANIIVNTIITVITTRP